MTTTPTPSSEIIHLVTTYVDAVDSLPPSLARSLSDLKELDAVLNGALEQITEKLNRLHRMMHPELAKTDPGGEADKVTPLDRLQLVRQVAEDARVFRLGGEDKIRVATNTCETVATHQAHLATLSSLLLSFLPAHLLPLLPGPAAPHGYPQSSSLSSQIARRQLFDYPPARHPGQGSTSRLTAALGLVREHYDLVRGGATGAGAGAAGGATGVGGGGARGAYAANGSGAGGSAAAATGGGGRKRAAQIDYSIYGDDYPGMPSATASRYGSATGGAAGGRRGADSNAAAASTQRHPNQYTKKRAAAAAANSPAMHQQHGAYGHPAYGVHGGPISAASINAAAGIYNAASGLGASPHHPYGGMTAVEAVKEKRRGAENNNGGGHAAAGASAMTASGSASRAGSVGVGVGSGGAGVGGAMAYGAGYSGMATPEEYNMAMYGATGAASQRAPAKRKVDEVSGASKRRKKGVDSPDLSARTLPGSGSSSRAPRRQGGAGSGSGTSSRGGASASNAAINDVYDTLPLSQQDYTLAGSGLGGAGVMAGGEDEFDPALEGADDDGDKTLYCFCQRVSFGEMIACDAPDCEHEWFHLPCVGLKSIPDGRWFCDECRRNSKAGKKRR